MPVSPTSTMMTGLVVHPPFKKSSSTPADGGNKVTEGAVPALLHSTIVNIYTELASQ